MMTVQVHIAKEIPKTWNLRPSWLSWSQGSDASYLPYPIARAASNELKWSGTLTSWAWR